MDRAGYAPPPRDVFEILGRDVQLVDGGVTTEVGRTQANGFRGAKVSRFEEHDFCFAV